MLHSSRKNYFKLPCPDSFLPFLPRPFNTSLKQEELFAIIKKNIPSFERLFRTYNARTTVTTLNQLETYYLDLRKWILYPTTNLMDARTIVKTTDLQTIIMEVSNHNQNNQQKSSNNQNGNNKWCHFHKSTSHNWAECSKNNAKVAQQKGNYQGNLQII